MTIQCEWFDDNKKIVLWTLDPQWVWAEVIATQQKSWHMIESEQDTIHCLIDMRACVAIPLGALKHIPELLKLQHPRCGSILIVLEPKSSLHKLWQTLKIMLPMIKHHTILIFTSIEEALAYLDNQDKSVES